MLEGAPAEHRARFCVPWAKMHHLTPPEMPPLQTPVSSATAFFGASSSIWPYEVRWTRSRWTSISTAGAVTLPGASFAVSLEHQLADCQVQGLGDLGDAIQRNVYFA